jgi:predicted aconitase
MENRGDKMEFKMELNQDERDILEGKQGETLQKIMKTVVEYGEMFGAKRLVPLTGASHLVTSYGMPQLEAMYDIMDEMIKNGIKAKVPFTVGPRPFDHKRVKTDGGEKRSLKQLYGKQKELEEKLKALGLRDDKAFTNTPYVPEVNNKPKEGDILAWSDPSAVTFVNSVFGARTNLNPPLIDLFCAVLGKAPEYGLLTDEGRKATWNVVINTRKAPNPQILGHAIGMKAQGQIPYIQGVDTFFGRKIEEDLYDFIQELSGVLAQFGIHQFHIDHTTPEAINQGKNLMAENPQVYIVDDEELADLALSYPSPWRKQKVKPAMCIIGYPQLNLHQVEYWTTVIFRGMKMHGKHKINTPTYLCVAPEVLAKFQTNYTLKTQVEEAGIQFTTMCPLAFLKNAKTAKKPVVTNSNVLRMNANVKYYDVSELTSIIATGRCQE